MPTYEYTCKSCGENIEVFQSFSAKPLKKHDVCGGDLQKVFHARGVVFKGSGWYTKDSKNGASASTESAKEPKKESGSESKKKDDGAKAKATTTKDTSST